MESAVFYLNAESYKVEFLGKIESVDEPHALRKLGEFGKPVVVMNPDIPGHVLLWSGRFGVGMIPNTEFLDEITTSLSIGEAQRPTLDALGDGNLSLGVYRALWTYGRCPGAANFLAGKHRITETIVVRMTDLDRSLAKRIGGGNISRGVRIALDFAVPPARDPDY